MRADSLTSPAVAGKPGEGEALELDDLDLPSLAGGVPAERPPSPAVSDKRGPSAPGRRAMHLQEGIVAGQPDEVDLPMPAGVGADLPALKAPGQGDSSVGGAAPSVPKPPAISPSHGDGAGGKLPGQWEFDAPSTGGKQAPGPGEPIEIDLPSPRDGADLPSLEQLDAPTIEGLGQPSPGGVDLPSLG